MPDGVPDDAPDGEVAAFGDWDGLILVVLRYERDGFSFDAEALDGELAVEHCEHNLVVHRFYVGADKRAIHDGDVACEDARAGHGVAVYPHQECRRGMLGEVAAQVDLVFEVIVRWRGKASSQAAHK